MADRECLLLPIRSSLPILSLLHPLGGLKPAPGSRLEGEGLLPVASSKESSTRRHQMIANDLHEGIAAEDWIDRNQCASGFAVLVNGLGCLLPCSRATPVLLIKKEKNLSLYSLSRVPVQGPRNSFFFSLMGPLAHSQEGYTGARELLTLNL